MAHCEKWWLTVRCGGSLVVRQTSGGEIQVQIRHLSQWSWGDAGSLCNTVKSHKNLIVEGGKFVPGDSLRVMFVHVFLA